MLRSVLVHDVSKYFPVWRQTSIYINTPGKYDCTSWCSYSSMKSRTSKVIKNNNQCSDGLLYSTSSAGKKRRIDDSIGAWNSRFNMKLDMETSLERGTLIPKVNLDNIGIYSQLGRRQTNEDRYLIEQLSSHLLLYAVFDGHGGSIASEFAKTYMADYISNSLEKSDDNKLEAVLKEAFIDLNNALTRHLKYDHSDLENCGSTATVCLLRNGHELVIGHVGDSKAMMCRKGKVVRLTVDHNPEDPREEERIKAAGGVITWTSIGRPRVNGRLNMTRSIGDVDLKKFGVTAMPETRSLEIKHGVDAFLVLISDGVSYSINDQECIDFISQFSNPLEAAQLLTDQALHFGSEDNSTAVVVPFGAWGKYSTSPTFSLGRSECWFFDIIRSYSMVLSRACRARDKTQASRFYCEITMDPAKL